MAQIKLNATYGLTGTLPAVSAANLTAIPAGNLTGTVADARITAVTSSKLTGNLPALNGSAVTNLTSGNLSGNLPALNGSALTTLNASNISSGTLNTSRYVQGGGKIGQVVYNENNNPSTISSSSTSYVTTGITVTITPTASNSKILLMFMSGVGSTASDGESMRQWYRNINSGGETALGAGGYGMANFANARFVPYGLTWIDTPNTTQSTVYSMWYKTDNGSNIAYAVWASSYYYMSAMEILA